MSNNHTINHPNYAPQLKVHIIVILVVEFISKLIHDLEFDVVCYKQS